MKKTTYLLVFLFFSCLLNRYFTITGYNYKDITTYDEEKELTLKKIKYIKVYDGIEIARLHNINIPLIITIVKISFKSSNLKIVTTEENRFEENGFVLAETTMSFAKRNNTNLAINANFFSYKSSFLDKFYKPLGLYISKGKLLSMPRNNCAMLIFEKDNHPIILSSPLQKDEILNKAIDGIAGFNQVLKDGNIIIKGKSQKIDSRTLIGVDNEEKTLFVLFVEGETKEKSIGSTLIFSANIMKEIGAKDAIELDGGGSSSLILKIGERQHQLVPSYKVPLRKVATNIGFIVTKE